MKILVLGSNGQLGRCLFDQFNKTDYEVVFATKAEVDLSNIASLKKIILAIKPQIVINAAAYTAVDKAEEEFLQADLINHLAVANIASTCNELGAWIIHISTDYVFDGIARVPYDENHQVSPKSVYGKSKLNGEIAIATSGSKYIILRTAWVFSEYGNNFLKTMLRLGKELDELNVVGDQRGCPTYAQDIAKSIISIVSKIDLDNSRSDIYHFCGDESCTWYEFALAIFKESKSFNIIMPKSINAIQTIDFPTAATRPHYSVLDCYKIKDTFNISPSNWRLGIKDALKNIGIHND